MEASIQAANEHTMTKICAFLITQVWEITFPSFDKIGAMFFHWRKDAD
jgi:hypothetical protein